MIPLFLAEAGESCVIGRISGSQAVRQHLETLGMTVGSTVRVVNTLAGNVIVQVKESRVALDKDLAGKIWIK